MALVDGRYMAWLLGQNQEMVTEALSRQALAPVLSALLHQAGVDPHKDDRLGRLALTDDGLAAREALVARAVARAGAALAVTLGGGYAHDPADVARRHALALRASWQAWNACARDAAA